MDDHENSSTLLKTEGPILNVMGMSNPVAGVGSWKMRTADAVAVGWCGFCCMLVLRPFQDAAGLPSPFVWRDVAIVAVISSGSFAISLSHVMRLILGPSQRLVTGIACWIAALGALAILMGCNLTGSGWSAGCTGAAIRLLLSLLLIAPAAWIWTNARISRLRLDSQRLAWCVVTGCIAIALPCTYITARCRQDVIQFKDLVGQSRLGEAAALANGVLRLEPDSELGGQSVARMAFDVNRAVRRLQAEVAETPGANAPDEVWILRARHLAILGQTDDAIAALGVVRSQRPDVFKLLGTIYETRGEWSLALDNYSQSNRMWEHQPATAERSSEQIQAVTGMAYCLRKQGRYQEAEDAYQKLLALAPNADVHFLLAQFYEDTQQTGRARDHVRQAMALAPDRFGESGKRLLNNLATMHLGCFIAD